MGAGWTFDRLFEALARGGDSPAVIQVGESGIETTSAAELDALSGRLAAGLEGEDLSPGDAVALAGANGLDWIACWLGLARAGAVIAAFDDLASDDEIAAAIADCGCRYVFAGPSHAGALAASRDSKAEVISLADTTPAGWRSWRSLLAPGPAPARPLAADAPAVTVYTSGTTGKPKSFTLTRANIAANIDGVLAHGLVTSRDRVLLPLPLHHVYPLVVGMLTPLSAGAAIVLPAAVSGAEVTRALALSHATVMVGVPRLYGAMVEGLEGRIRAGGRAAAALFGAMLRIAIALKRRTGINAGRLFFAAVHQRLGGGLRILVSGGAKLEPAVIWPLEGLGFEVLSGYGLAETASLFTGNVPGAKRIGAEGRPMVAGSEARIASPDEEGIGEVQLKGPNVFAGYRNDPGANSSAFAEDGWFRTGDLGRLDADGFLHITGRSKEMIVLGGGKNVFPEELEKRYAAHPAIAEIAVLERDGRLVALVAPDLGALRAEAKTRAEDAVRMALHDGAAGLPSYQRLAGFAITREPLPRTRLGKYRRFMLPELYERARRGGGRRQAQPLTEADRDLLADPVAAKVWAILDGRYRERGLGLDSNCQLDLGIDSLEWMTLSMEIENRLGIRFGEDAYGRIETVRDLITEAGDAPPVTEPESGPPREAESWITPPGPFVTALGILLYGVNWALMRLYFRLRVRGRAKLPREPRAMVVAANHASDIDPAVLAAALPLAVMRRLWWGGEAVRIFSGRVGRTFARVAHIFPVDERRPQAALDMAGRVLDRGDAMGWFPESWRTPSGELQRFLPGIGMVCAGRDVEIVPVYIDGAFEAMPRNARFPRPGGITVRFGNPVSPAVLASEGRGANEADRIADGLRARVAALAPPAKPDEDR